MYGAFEDVLGNGYPKGPGIHMAKVLKNNARSDKCCMEMSIKEPRITCRIHKSLIQVHFDGTVTIFGLWQFTDYVPQKIKQSRIIMIHVFLIAPARLGTKMCKRCDRALLGIINLIQCIV